MDQCFRCEKNSKEVKLHDAIYENDLVKVCERCAITENIPVLKRPSTTQLKASETSEGVYQRLKRISGQEEKEREHKSVLDEIKKLDENPQLERPDKEKPLNLINNFHWHAARARRNRGLSTKQLAWALGESETAIKMVERADLPEEPERLIRKMEQFFQIHLRERTKKEIEEEKKRKQERNIQVEIEPIQAILEEEIEEEDLAQVQRSSQTNETEQKTPSQVLRFKPELMDNITIADLKKIKEEKEEQDLLEQEKLKEIKKKEVQERVGQEMKNMALGKETESIKEKRRMLNQAMKKTTAEEKKETPTIHQLLEKKKDKEKSRLQEEKLKIQGLEKKSEQEQIKQILRGDIAEIKPEKKPEPKQEFKEETKEPVVTISQLKQIKEQEKEDSLLGDEIEIIEDE